MRLATPTLAFDILAFGSLHFLVNSHYNLLAYLTLFPALTGAIRFGPRLGLGIAAVMSISTLLYFFFPGDALDKRSLLIILLPTIALIGGTAITGFLSQHEKEAAVEQAAQELKELRGAVAGAKLLYRTADSLSLTTNYTPVLESMLEAGVKGLPAARHEDGYPVGLTLCFDDSDTDKHLQVVASRNLQRQEEKIRVRGVAGIIGETLRINDAVAFDDITKDPELAAFRSLSHCHAGVCYPLHAGLEQYGVVLLAGPAPRRPSQDHLELMQAFTSQAGIAFQNARLYQASRQEQDRIIISETEMRQKLARDLHDGPTQKIAGLVMQLDFINRLMDQNPAEAKAEIAKARETAQQTVKEIRTALFTLRPLSLETKGLSAAVQQLVERLREVDHLNVQFSCEEFGAELDQNIAMTIFSIIEEALGNAKKHAPNAPILVSIHRKEGTLVAIVQDQGPGFDVAKVESSYDQRTSLGLQNMRERANLVDGNLRIDSAPGQGTRVTLVAPLPPPNQPGFQS